MSKVALVTGASRGIGAAIAEKLAADGFFVIINYCGSKEKAKEVEMKVNELPGKGVAMACNVSDFEACEAFIKEIVKEYGAIDVLVNNAGITRDGLLMAMKKEQFMEVIETNLCGTFHTMKAVTRPMLKQKGGRIINISSIVGVHGNAGQANYAASKAGIIGLTKSAAKEFASRGITVNAVAPGFIKTDMTDVLSDSVKESILSEIPMNTLGEPEDIANIVAFLAGDGGRYITGQVIGVDGGMGI